MHCKFQVFGSFGKIDSHISSATPTPRQHTIRTRTLSLNIPANFFFHHKHYTQIIFFFISLSFIFSIDQPSTASNLSNTNKLDTLKIKTIYYPLCCGQTDITSFVSKNICEHTQIPSEWGEGDFDFIIYAFARNSSALAKYWGQLEPPCTLTIPSGLEFESAYKPKTDPSSCSQVEYKAVLNESNHTMVYVVYQAKKAYDWDIVNTEQDIFLLKHFQLAAKEAIPLDILQHTVSQMHVYNWITGEVVEINLVNLPSLLRDSKKREQAFKYMETSVLGPEKHREKTDIILGNFNTRMIYSDNKQGYSKHQKGRKTIPAIPGPHHLDDTSNYNLCLKYTQELLKGKKSTIGVVDELEELKKSILFFKEYDDIEITMHSPPSNSFEAKDPKQFIGIDQEGRRIWGHHPDAPIAPSKTIKCLVKPNINDKGRELKVIAEFSRSDIVPFGPKLVAQFEIPVKNHQEAITVASEPPEQDFWHYTPLSIYFNAANSVKLANACAPGKRPVLLVENGSGYLLYKRELSTTFDFELGFLSRFRGGKILEKIIQKKEKQENNSFELVMKLICLKGEEAKPMSKKHRKNVILLKGEFDLTKVVQPSGNLQVHRYETVLKSSDKNCEIEGFAVLLLLKNDYF